MGRLKISALLVPAAAGLTGALPHLSSPVRRGDRLVFLLGLAAYTATYLACFPKQPAIIDENEYLSQALLFRSGHITYENSGVPASALSVREAGRIASKYPPGNGLFLVPFALLGWKAVFLSGLLLALFGTLLFRAALRRLLPDAEPSWSLLYLFYPAVVLFSRTIMSDLLAATAVLAGFLFIFPRPGPRFSTPRFRGDPDSRPLGPFWAGLCLGFACLTRYSAVLFVPLFLLLLVAAGQGRMRNFFLFLCGLLPCALAAFTYNAVCYGGPLRFPMYLTGVFSPIFFPANFLFYSAVLAVVYPLMLFAPLLAPGRYKLLLALPAYSVPAFYSFFSYASLALPLQVRALVDLRYLLPAVPFFLLGYVILLRRIEARHAFLRQTRLLLTLALLLLSIALHVRHSRHLTVQENYRNLLLHSVPEDAFLACNAGVSELLHPAWGWRESRRFVEHGVPVPLGREVSRRDTVYAALLQRKRNLPELAVFHALLAGFPDRKLVAATEKPYCFQVYRLKPDGSDNSPVPWRQSGADAELGETTHTR